MKELVIVRGGGDIATGTIYKLVKSGFRVLVLETAAPSAIRRNVAFSEAVYDGISKVEDMTCRLAATYEEAEKIMEQGDPALMIDPEGKCLEYLKPLALVDAILAKKNLGTRRDVLESRVLSVYIRGDVDNHFHLRHLSYRRDGHRVFRFGCGDPYY